MPSLGHQQYQDSIGEWIETCGDQPGVAEALYFYQDVLLVLWHLDLEPARPVLERCWADNPRGGCRASSKSSSASRTLPTRRTCSSASP